MRSSARECVFKVIYASIMNDEELVKLRNDLYVEANLNQSDIEFANELLDKFFENKDTINNIISDIAFGYKLERLFMTDRCILSVAITEMTYFNSIPLIVSISEGMELVRKYSSEDSPNFVNGILAEYKKRLENGNS